MKNIFKKIIIILMLSIILDAQTIWEEYISNPNNNENSKQLNSIEYTHENRIDRDIQILAKRIISLDKNSIEVAMQLLLSSKSNFDGYLAPYIRETLSTIIKGNAKLYIDSLKNIKSTKCLAVTSTTVEFVDKDKKVLEEYRLRKASLESLANSYLKALCINDLNIAIKEQNTIVQEVKIKSNQSYQIYQKLNKYNILLMLIQSSTSFPPRKIYNLKKLYFADTVELENRIAFLLRVEKEGEELMGRDVNSYMTIGSFGYNILTNEFYDNNHYIDAKYTTYAYPKTWSKIFNIYHLNQPREYLFLKEKTYLYKKPNLKSKSKKFLIKNDCALIVDKTNDGWYKVFYYHPRWYTNTIMWIKFDDDKHGLIR